MQFQINDSLYIKTKQEQSQRDTLFVFCLLIAFQLGLGFVLISVGRKASKSTAICVRDARGVENMHAERGIAFGAGNCMHRGEAPTLKKEKGENFLAN